MHRATNWFLALAAVLGTGCVALGPTPGLTFASAVPSSRPSVEVSAAIVPGYMLSNAVTQPTANERQYGTPMRQYSLLVDPSSLLGNSGLSGGVRVLHASDGYFEPELRWRRSFFDHDLLSAGATISGTLVSYQDAEHPGIGYRAGRGTLEAGVEVRVTPPWWVELRAIGGGSASALSASGTWCANANDGVAAFCPTDTTPALNVSGSAMGVYWSLYGGVAVDALRPQSTFFHFARIAGVVAAGSLPTMVPATPQPGITQSVPSPVTQGSDALWAYWGLSATIAFGLPGEPSSPGE